MTPVFGLKSGYVERAAAMLPKQGSRPPWRFHNNYPLDFLLSRMSSVTSGMEFSRASEQEGLPVTLGA